MKNKHEQKACKGCVPIIVLGTIGIIGISCLTLSASSSVVDKINKNADIAYAQTISKCASLSAEQSDSDESNTSASLTDNTVTDYKSSDLVQVADKWYVLSDLLDSTKTNGTQVPITVDSTKNISVGNKQYSYIENQDAVCAADSSGKSCFGSAYVVVDVDGDMVYLVKKGDTLTDVSGRVGYSVQELADSNCIDNVNLIYAGQTLRIPASAKAIESVKSTNTVSGNDSSN